MGGGKDSRRMGGGPPGPSKRLLEPPSHSFGKKTKSALTTQIKRKATGASQVNSETGGLV